MQERDELAAQLTKAQLVDAQRLAREWTPGHAMGVARVKTAAVAPAPEQADRPVRVAAAGDGFPPRPAHRAGVTSCNTRCDNGQCLRTYDSGKQVRFQANRVYDAMSNDWVWDSGTC